jgi:hypothetical protein
LGAELKRQVRGEIGRHQRRPAVWAPGETLVIHWGQLSLGLMMCCAVLPWSWIRFVRVARDQTAATTMAMLADCFDELGGVPAKVLTDRMGCLKGGTVAGVMIPTPDFARTEPNRLWLTDITEHQTREGKV